MPFRTEKRITRAMLRAEPDTLFVFGDNLARFGMGGQAKEMRGEPNAVGVPTKFYPSMTDTSFLCDRDVDRALPAINEAFIRLFVHAALGGTVVWPEDGIGTGLAQLPQRAPKICAYIDRCRLALSRL